MDSALSVTGTACMSDILSVIDSTSSALSTLHIRLGLHNL